MPLTAGSRLGPYEILVKLGEGGMGEVYRARDPKLRRDVAIKVLPSTFAADADRLRRLSREAQLLASLNHPNIAAIYELEDTDGAALVMELVEGDTLADRIARGPLSVTEAVAIASEICGGLAAAHQQGIVHRDLKPANIKVTRDGHVKILDFGLAKTVLRDTTAELSAASTITADATRPGMVVGTVSYMSPEQVRGEPVDRRTDVWSFGCVLFEMLTGTRAFGGDNSANVLASVLKSEPDWSRLHAPPVIARLLRHSLTKDVAQRWSDLGDAALTMADASMSSEGAAGHDRRRSPFIVSAAAVLLIGAVTAGFLGGRRYAATPTADARVVRTELNLADSAALTFGGYGRDFALSTGGTELVYVGDHEQRIFRRALNGLDSVSVYGPAPPNPQQPVFSPDGQTIGFFAPFSEWRRLSNAGVQRPAVQTALSSRGVAWDAAGGIFLGTHGGDLLHIDDAGKIEPVASVDPSAREIGLWWPQLLPGGATLLVTVARTGSIDDFEIAAVDLRTHQRKPLLRGSDPRYVGTGHLLFAREGAMWAVRFDPAAVAVSDSPVRVVDTVATTPYGAAELSIASDGTLAFARGGNVGARTLMWVDRQGRESNVSAEQRPFVYPRIAPDGTTAVVDIRDASRDLWTVDLARGTLRRLTTSPGLEQFPLWAPDGKQVYYSSVLQGHAATLRSRADGTGVPQEIRDIEAFLPYAISPDGTRMLVSGGGFTGLVSSGNGWVRQTGKPTESGTTNPEISPDGKWVVYQSRQSGASEIFVRPFPNFDDGRWQVSVGGGTRPVWSRTMKEIFYLSPNGAMMSLSIVRGTQFSTLPPVKLFDNHDYHIGGASEPFRSYDAASDGSRFLMIKDSPLESSKETRLIIVQNWFQELTSRVTVK